ncbi:hypothetical protein Golomagni_00808 [Golovinomyces magnicellulatus]|nr:hypothetical protein Golomagni_00808 [Golovinomyces magnicellulatus]
MENILFYYSKKNSPTGHPIWSAKIKSPFKKIFRDYLHKNGVYTGKKTTAIGPEMMTLLSAEELPEWPREIEQSMQDQ